MATSSTSLPRIDADPAHQLSVHADRITDPTLGSSETRAGVRGAGTGAGTGAGAGSDGSHPGTRRSTVSHHSVHIVLPEEDDEEDHSESRSLSSRSSYSTCSSSAGSAHICSRKSDAAFHDDDDDVDDGNVGGGASPSARQLFWTYVGLTPVLLSILALFAGLLQWLPAAENGIVLHWDRFGVGMIGWSIAFGLRTPIFALFSSSHLFHLNDLLCEWCTLLSAAALEEALRLGLITLLGIRQDFGELYWMGLGWAGIETAYYIAQSMVYSRWLSDDDYRAVSTSAITTTTTISPRCYEGYGAVVLPTTAPVPGATGDQDHGTTKALGPTPIDSLSHHNLSSNYNNNSNNNNNNSNNDDDDDDEGDLIPTRVARHLLGIDRPWWSLMGRTSSMMVHIGLGCWLGHSGAGLLLPAVLVHGALYVIWGIFLPDQWSVPATSYGTFMAAMAIFLIGLALYGQIV